jgi:hypothetical protein
MFELRDLYNTQYVNMNQSNRIEDFNVRIWQDCKLLYDQVILYMGNTNMWSDPYVSS